MVLPDLIRVVVAPFTRVSTTLHAFITQHARLGLPRLPAVTTAQALRTRYWTTRTCLRCAYSPRMRFWRTPFNLLLLDRAYARCCGSRCAIFLLCGSPRMLHCIRAFTPHHCDCALDTTATSWDWFWVCLLLSLRARITSQGFHAPRRVRAPLRFIRSHASLALRAHPRAADAPPVRALRTHFASTVTRITSHILPLRYLIVTAASSPRKLYEYRQHLHLHSVLAVVACHLSRPRPTYTRRALTSDHSPHASPNPLYLLLALTTDLTWRNHASSCLPHLPRQAFVSLTTCGAPTRHFAYSGCRRASPAYFTAYVSLLHAFGHGAAAAPSFLCKQNLAQRVCRVAGVGRFGRRGVASNGRDGTTTPHTAVPHVHHHTLPHHICTTLHHHSTHIVHLFCYSFHARAAALRAFCRTHCSPLPLCCRLRRSRGLRVTTKRLRLYLRTRASTLTLVLMTNSRAPALGTGLYIRTIPGLCKTPSPRFSASASAHHACATRLRISALYDALDHTAVLAIWTWTKAATWITY